MGTFGGSNDGFIFGAVIEENVEWEIAGHGQM
jgi:hypothetical protein